MSSPLSASLLLLATTNTTCSTTTTTTASTITTGPHLGEKSLPEGPVFLSPTRLLESLHREVILRNPEDFKIACLKDIMKLWENRVPFCAGFGNRISDFVSYAHIGIEHSRIFTINHHGEVTCASTLNTLTYKSLNEFVDMMFPPKKPAVEQRFGEFGFWQTSRLQGYCLEDVEATLKGTKNK
eukprot:TRINITY_DN8154_c0_g4_i2.p1 TRINITY_DN8154_c0_g4~~TRINITY_DN8154_c0_g4_i2.p1  ORF type:complete len:191 (+),score=39.11 TRINITY_DN8154_c0_g4_i2:26-574(+)